MGTCNDQGKGLCDENRRRKILPYVSEQWEMSRLAVSLLLSTSEAPGDLGEVGAGRVLKNRHREQKVGTWAGISLMETITVLIGHLPQIVWVSGCSFYWDISLSWCRHKTAVVMGNYSPG